MTLASCVVGALRNGFLLCADREEDDAYYTKREVDKIYHAPELKTCEVFIAGAGPSGCNYQDMYRDAGSVPRSREQQ